MNIYLCIKKGKAMMTKEEVAEMVTYCEEKKICYKQRMADLGINAGCYTMQNEDMHRSMKATMLESSYS